MNQKWQQELELFLERAYFSFPFWHNGDRLMGRKCCSGCWLTSRSWKLKQMMLSPINISYQKPWSSGCGKNSRLWGHEFVSKCRILDGSFFTYLVQCWLDVVRHITSVKLSESLISAYHDIVMLKLVYDIGYQHRLSLLTTTWNIHNTTIKVQMFQCKWFFLNVVSECFKIKYISRVYITVENFIYRLQFHNLCLESLSSFGWSSD